MSSPFAPIPSDSEEAVLQQILADAGQLIVVGAEYSIESGEVEFFDD